MLSHTKPNVYPFKESVDILARIDLYDAYWILFREICIDTSSCCEFCFCYNLQAAGHRSTEADELTLFPTACFIASRITLAAMTMGVPQCQRLEACVPRDLNAVYWCVITAQYCGRYS